MENNYNEQIIKNKNVILQLEDEIRKTYSGEINNKNYGIDYGNTDLENIIDEQRKYIDYLNSLTDMIYQSKDNEYKEKIEKIIESGNINVEFYRLYNMGRFIYNNKYYPINKIYIKVYKNSIDNIYELISTEEKEFSILSKSNIDISEYKYIRLFKFKESSIFKNIYKDKRICNIFDININSEDSLKIFLEYLNNFDEKQYNFIKELSGEKYE